MGAFRQLFWVIVEGGGALPLAGLQGVGFHSEPGVATHDRAEIVRVVQCARGLIRRRGERERQEVSIGEVDEELGVIDKVGSVNRRRDLRGTLDYPIILVKGGRPA